MNEKTKLNKVSDHETNQFWRTIAIGAIVVIVFLSLPHLCSADCGHSHDHHDHEHHHHHQEPASFKWSKQANEAHEVNSHHHTEHLHGHDHHSHDHNGHDHHSHSHGSPHTEKAPKNTQSKSNEKTIEPFS